MAWEGDRIVGYGTYERGVLHRWTRHVAEFSVAVAQSVRGIGIGRLLLELAFEMVLDAGATKVVARMTPDQTGVMNLFKRLGFSQEAVLRDHALGAGGVAQTCSCSLSAPVPTRNNDARTAGLPSWTLCRRWCQACLALLRNSLPRAGGRRIGVAHGVGPHFSSAASSTMAQKRRWLAAEQDLRTGAMDGRCPASSRPDSVEFSFCRLFG